MENENEVNNPLEASTQDPMEDTEDTEMPTEMEDMDMDDLEELDKEEETEVEEEEGEVGSINGIIELDSEALPSILEWDIGEVYYVLSAVKVLDKYDGEEEGFTKATLQILDMEEDV